MEGPNCLAYISSEACAGANAFRCQWNMVNGSTGVLAGRCDPRALAPLASCRPFGIAFSGSSLFVAGVEMQASILFANESVRDRAVVYPTPSVVDASHPCFDDAAAFAVDITDASKWAGGAITTSSQSVFAPGWTPAPGIHHLNATIVLQLTGDVIFDARGDPEAFWVMRVTVAALQLNQVNMRLVNGARPHQVTWVLEGAMQVGPDTATVAPARLVGAFIFTHANPIVTLAYRPIVDGSFLVLGAAAEFTMRESVFGSSGSCAHAGDDVAACRGSGSRCQVSPTTRRCENIGCPAHFDVHRSCPSSRCRLDDSLTYCATGLECSRAKMASACLQVDHLRCQWDDDAGVCSQRMLPAFPAACSAFTLVFNSTNSHEYVVEGVAGDGQRLVGFARDTNDTHTVYDPRHACFPAAVDYARDLQDGEVWRVRTSDAEVPAPGDWVVEPGVHRFVSKTPVFTRTGAVVFDAQSDPRAFWVVDVQRLVLDTNSRVQLRNGANPQNIVWLTRDGADLFTPYVPGTVVALPDEPTVVSTIATDSATATIDGRLVSLDSDAGKMLIPGATLLRPDPNKRMGDSCFAMSDATNCHASPLQCTFDTATHTCEPTRCYAPAQTAASCPLHRCRRVPAGTIGDVCASGLRCSMARTAEQCAGHYWAWKDCMWESGSCVEAYRALPSVPACNAYSAVVAVPSAPSIAQMSKLDMGERSMLTDVLPTAFDTITPTQDAARAQGSTLACLSAMSNSLVDFETITERVPARPPPDWLEHNAMVLRRGTYTTKRNSATWVDGTITFDAEGDPHAQWVIYAEADVTLSRRVNMRLVNRAKQSNIFWVGARDAVTHWSTERDDVASLLAPPLLGTFVQLNSAGRVHFHRRKIAGRVLSRSPDVDLTESAFVNACYMHADRDSCAASTALLCSFDESSQTCGAAPCGDPRWIGTLQANTCPAHRCRRAGEMDAGGEGGRTCIDGPDCSAFTTAAGCHSLPSPRCQWADGVCARKRLHVGAYLDTACEGVGAAFGGEGVDDFRMHGVYMGHNRSIVSATPRFGTARTLRAYVRDANHACLGALRRMAADLHNEQLWPISTTKMSHAPYTTLVLAPGVYDFPLASFFLTSLTFDAAFDPDAYWIMRVPTILLAETLSISLVNRAQMKNIVWLGLTPSSGPTTTWTLNAPFIPGIFVHPAVDATVTMQSRIKMGLLATLGARSKLSIQHSVFVDSTDELLPTPEVRVVRVEVTEPMDEVLAIAGPIAIGMVGAAVLGYLGIAWWKARMAKAAAQAAVESAVVKGRAKRLEAHHKRDAREQREKLVQKQHHLELSRISFL